MSSRFVSLQRIVPLVKQLLRSILIADVDEISLGQGASPPFFAGDRPVIGSVGLGTASSENTGRPVGSPAWRASARTGSVTARGMAI